METFERIKLLRKELKLSQTEFGERVGVSRSVINNIELNRVEPKELFLKSICKEYHVNYPWLTEGKGEMLEEDTNFIINQLVDEYKLDELDKKIVAAYAELSHDDRMIIKDYLKSVFE